MIKVLTILTVENQVAHITGEVQDKEEAIKILKEALQFMEREQIIEQEHVDDAVEEE